MYKLLSLILLQALLCLAITGVSARQKEVVIPVTGNMVWWCGISNHGELLPMHNGYHANLNSNYGNQVQPLLLSNMGHVIWSEQPFEITMKNDTLTVISSTPSLIYTKSGTTLKEGFKYASENYFPPAGKLPDELLFSAPQYNTWIELTYNQNQEDILNYARQVIANGFPPGVLMIDDNWQEDYGKWDFHPGRFPNPKGMMDSLHQMGFKVMVWVCPFVSPDCDVYRMLRDKNLLLKDKSGRAAIVRWWNGASALLDLSNDETVGWFQSRLNYLQEKYEVDGFKFDAGDFSHYTGCYSSEMKPVAPQAQCELYARVGLKYPLNEYRAMWKMAGQPLVNRLRDKAHNWGDLQKLIPDILLQGFMGYNFTCPDMVGGGEYGSFLEGSIIDQDLIVRSAQCHALMPMMQFSVAPWRILDEKHLDACKKAVELRKKYTPLILGLAKESAYTGAPIVQSMEYVFPHQGYERVKGQFLLGENVLVAPLLEKGEGIRKVLIPEGKWKNTEGGIIKGPKTIEITVAMDELPVFERIE
ncbi:MAG: glycoside hydrolase [Chlorobi bacterium]|nr:glycoside hydrolase [Chlorobiota bacterium]